MDFVDAIPVRIPCILALGVIDRFMCIPPLRQTCVDVILIRVDEAAHLDILRDDRLDGGLLDVREPVDRKIAVALDQTEHGWLFLRQRASTTRTFQPATTTLSASLPHDFRVSFMPCHDVDFVTFHHAVQADRLFFATTPSRSWVVIAWTSLSCKSNSAAICWFDRFRPIRYKHTTQTFKG